MAKSGCLMDLKSSLIRELYKVNMTDEQFSEMQKTVNSSVYEMYMNTKIEKIEKDASELYASDFINHSGGALGADITFDEIGNEYGFKYHKHYYHGVRNENNAPHGNEKIDSLSYGQGKAKAALAAKRNWGYQNSTVSDPRLIRNWSQVKNSSTVFAISTIVGKGQKIFPDQKSDTRIAVAPSVTGGTGYAVGMAINEDKKIYVFNQKSLDKDYPAGWYVYDKATDNFIPTETPVLTENYAGIGSRNLTEEGTQAIRDLFENTLSKSKSNGTVSTLEPEINIYSTDKNGFETLSNLSPREFTFNGKQYHSVEHAYQTLKTGKFNESVFNEYNNRYASGMQLGKFTGGTKADINTSYQLMKDLIRSSVDQNEDIKKLLLSTKNSSLTHSQEEGFWKEEFPKILMEVRNELLLTSNTTTNVYSSDTNVSETKESLLSRLSDIDKNINDIKEDASGSLTNAVIGGFWNDGFVKLVTDAKEKKLKSANFERNEILSRLKKLGINIKEDDNSSELKIANDFKNNKLLELNKINKNLEESFLKDNEETKKIQEKALNDLDLLSKDYNDKKISDSEHERKGEILFQKSTNSYTSKKTRELLSDKSYITNSKEYEIYKKYESSISGSGPKEWISGNNESEFYVFERESVADFINVIETNTGDLTARTDNAGYHSLISGLMGLIQNTLKDAELTKTIDVALIKTKDAYSNARFIRGEENFYGEDPTTGEKILETGDRLEVRYGTDVDMDRLVEEGPKKGTIVDDYSNGLQGFRELMVHDMLHCIVDDVMHMNRELYNKAASIQSQYSKYVTVDAMIKAMKDRSGFDATAAQIEQIKDIVNYINGSPVEFMMYALTNPMVYEIMDNAGKTESAKYDLIDTSGRAIRDKRFQKSKFRALMDKLVDIINNTYKQIKIGMKMSDGKVAEKNGIDVLKDTIMMAAVKNLEGTGLNKEQRERKLSDAQYGDYNLGGALDLSDKYKEYNERIKKFNDKIFSKTIDTGDRFKVGERVEAFGSWMNKFSLIKDNREKGRFRLFSDVINTIVEDTTSRSNGAADFYKIFREIKGSRDRDKIEMIQTAREMLDKNWIDVSKEERESMSYFMQTDWKSLGLDLDSYSELLSDNAKLDSEIGRLKSDIGVTEYNENAKFLGYYMVNGVSKAPELMRNANMIVNRVYGSGNRNPLVKQSDVNLTISKVDKLATMYAMKYLSQNDKDNIVKTIKSQRDLVQATSNLYYSYSDEQTKKFAQVGLDKYIMKGYVKKSSVVDMKFEIVESSKVRKNKYVAHTDIRIDNSIGKILKDGKTYHLVVSRDYDTARTQGGFDDIHIIDKQIGIRDIYSGSDKEMIGRIINSNDMFKAIHKDKTKGTSYKLSTATSDDMNDLAMMEDQLIPSYDVSGNVIDYEIPISSDIRKKYGREINDIANTVAQTISHINRKDNAIGNNRKFAEMLISESDSNEGKPGYVLLRPTSQEERDKGIRHKYDEEWAMIPKYIQDAILSKDEYGDNIRDGLWVKEGRINNIIGYKDPSIANLKLFGKDLTDYPNMQRAVQVMESYWKALSSRYKEIVVKYFPNVVWANITSNMWVAMRHGVGPLEYAKSFIRHWSSLTDYLETVDEINMLKLEDKSGTSKNKNRIEALEEKLVRNPFNLLIKDGQFSTIMEDLDMSGMTKKTHIQDYIDTTAERFDNVGIESKEFIANIYATRGSAANRTLEKLTVFNDIINRSIIMERMMQDLEKIKFNNEDDKTQKIQDILNYVDMLFVNYSYLDNKYLKYANDTNILQFTKYFFRALKANISMMSRNPLSTIGFESFDEFAFDLSDSFDQYASPITGLSNRFIPNPVQMFQDVVTPHTAAVLFH